MDICSSSDDSVEENMETVDAGQQKLLLFGWGSTVDGELGLGGIEEHHILSPRNVNFDPRKSIKYMACGEHHTLVVTFNGKVYSCGNNDFGQLGHDRSRTKLHEVSGLELYRITHVCCGEYHSLAINEWGQLYTWGSNSHGQLGYSTTGQDTHITSQPVPKIVKTLATKHIIQVSCGHKHCLALTNDGVLYSWGLNDCGQLGIGVEAYETSHSIPSEVTSLSGLYISVIACGGYHSFAVSKSGAVFGWGKNSFGQLGLNSQLNQHLPSHLHTMRSIRVKNISCGEDFSVFLTEDGGVFTCGAGMYGQLGHGTFTNEILPRKVMELMGTVCTQISCGRRHTLVFIPSRGRVYAFGLGSVGQLGIKNSKNLSIPQIVLGPWITEESHINCIVKRIYCGGDHCFVTVSRGEDNIAPEDCRYLPLDTQIWTINEQNLAPCQTLSKNDPVDQEVMKYVETAMNSVSCLNGSFLNKDTHFCCNSRNHGLEIDHVFFCFNMISSFENQSILEMILDSITALISNLPTSVIDIEILRIYLILPVYHMFMNPKYCESLQVPFGSKFLRIVSSIEDWYKSVNSDYFEMLIRIFKNVFIRKLDIFCTGYDIRWDSSLVIPLEVLSQLNRINKANYAVSDKIVQYIVPCDTFYVPELRKVDIRTDYLRWVFEPNKHQNYFCNYPFLFDAEAKTTLLQTDQALQMQNAMNQATERSFATLFFSSALVIDQFFDIHVSREKIVEDAIREISMRDCHDLKKPLRVHFLGEEAEDAGGVRKEFFMLVLRNILDPKYGMFQSYEESRTLWFREDSFEDDVMFFLIGSLCGLAIYNFTIINLPFPLALYKKLLEEPVTLQDLKELSPIIYKSLSDLLNYEGDDVEDVFALNFSITKDVFGHIQVVPLKPGGENIPVTQENKYEFVDRYVDMILNKSVDKQFQAFKEGFLKVCGGRVLKLFHPQELMSVVIGNEDYDWYELENNADYKKGYTSSDPTIRMFWEVFHELPLEDKKKFLLYLTGSDRIPIQGMKAIRIIIQPTLDEKYLPVAHTCFNLLDLPRYKTKERLRYKLLQAIQHTEGFSLV